MPQVSRRFSLRATVAGAITGVVSFTGLAVAADTASGWMYGVGAGVAAIGIAVGTRRLRGSAETMTISADLAAGGSRRASPIDAPAGKIATIHSVETTLAGDNRISRLGLTVVDRISAADTYATSVRARIPAMDLDSAIGERKMANIKEVRDLPGAVLLPDTGLKATQYSKAVAAEIPSEVPDARNFTFSPNGVVSRGMVATCFCAAFAVFGTATGVLLPDTAGPIAAAWAAVSSITPDSPAGSGGAEEATSAIGRFGLDALTAMAAMAAKDLPGSTKHVLGITFYGSWAELEVLDDVNTERVIYHATNDLNAAYDPDRVEVTHTPSASARVRNTFPLSDVDTATIVAAYDTVTQTLGTQQTQNDRVEIRKEADAGADAEPTVAINVQSKVYEARLDGTVAPIFDPLDTAAVMDQLNAALVTAGIDPAAALIDSVTTTENGARLSTGTTSLSGPTVDITVESGRFPSIETEQSGPAFEGELFSLSQVTPGQLTAIAAANGARIGAEEADIKTAVFTIRSDYPPGSDYDEPRVLQVQVEFQSMAGSRAIYLPDGTFLAAD